MKEREMHLVTGDSRPLNYVRFRGRSDRRVMTPLAVVWLILYYNFRIVNHDEQINYIECVLHVLNLNDI